MKQFPFSIFLTLIAFSCTTFSMDIALEEGVNGEQDARDVVTVMVPQIVKEEVTVMVLFEENSIMRVSARVIVPKRTIFELKLFIENFLEVNKEAIEGREEISNQDFLKRTNEAIKCCVDKLLLSNLGGPLTEKKRRWAQVNLEHELLFQFRLVLKNEEGFVWVV